MTEQFAAPIHALERGLELAEAEVQRLLRERSAASQRLEAVQTELDINVGVRDEYAAALTRLREQ